MKTVYDVSFRRLVELYEPADLLFVKDAGTGLVTVYPADPLAERFAEIISQEPELYDGKEAQVLTLADDRKVIIAADGTHTLVSQPKKQSEESAPIPASTSEANVPSVVTGANPDTNPQNTIGAPGQNQGDSVPSGA